MIIVEGPDGGGKTTLARQLSEKFDLPIAPRVVSKETEAMVDLKQWTEDNTRLGFQLTIFDRHRLISEPIYGPIMRRGKIEPGFGDLPWLMWQMARFYEAQPLIIYAIPPLEMVIANVQNDPDNVVVVDQIVSIYQAYVSRAAFDYARDSFCTQIWNYNADGREADPLRPFDMWQRVIDMEREKQHG